MGPAAVLQWSSAKESRKAGSYKGIRWGYQGLSPMGSSKGSHKKAPNGDPQVRSTHCGLVISPPNGVHKADLPKGFPQRLFPTGGHPFLIQ